MSGLDELRVPDVIGECVGYRAWQLYGPVGRERLMSVNAGSTVGVDDAIWPTGGWFYAVCPSDCEDIPEPRCSCGLYAAKTFQHLLDYGYGKSGQDTLLRDSSMVLGTVGFAGKVIEGAQGWRAEKGRVHSLIVPNFERWTLAKRLGAAYGVPISLGIPNLHDPIREEI